MVGSNAPGAFHVLWIKNYYVMMNPSTLRRAQAVDKCLPFTPSTCISVSCNLFKVSPDKPSYCSFYCLLACGPSHVILLSLHMNKERETTKHRKLILVYQQLDVHVYPLIFSHFVYFTAYIDSQNIFQHFCWQSQEQGICCLYVYT